MKRNKIYDDKVDRIEKRFMGDSVKILKLPKDFKFLRLGKCCKAKYYRNVDEDTKVLLMELCHWRNSKIANLEKIYTCRTYNKRTPYVLIKQYFNIKLL